MKKNLLVTLANSDYVERSKQLFSSVWHNAGWEGDMMLLSYKIPEQDLNWFRTRGILVYECEDIPGLGGAPGRWSAVALHKFNLFKVYFKQWDHLLYLDSDIIVRASLDALISSDDGFVAVKGGHVNFRHSFFSTFQTWLEKKDTGLCKEIEKKYDMNSDVFNGGVFAFSSNCITQELFDTAVSIHNRYGSISTCFEELTSNLLFPNWIKLPVVYNLDPDFFIKTTSLRPTDIDGVILHFIAQKPWDKQNPFFDEWNLYYRKADEITATKVLPAKKISTSEIEIIVHKLFKRTYKGEYKKFLYYGNIVAQKYIGLVGLIIKRVSPRLYRTLLVIKTRLV